MPKTTTRAEHMAWCKQRALEYVDRGDLESAIASMLSDMGKHEETQSSVMIGSMIAPRLAYRETNSAAFAYEVRRWIEGFN